MKKIFNFKDQLSIGNKGEALFLEYYSASNPTKETVSRAYDFNVDGKTVELKSDYYSMAKTPNFFMEFYSDADKKSIGGPWRAKRDNVDFFVYTFVPDKTFFWFNPEELCDEIDKLIIGKQYRPKRIRNTAWITEGYTIPRELIKHLIVKTDTF